MAPLLIALGLFFVVGIAQAIWAGRIVDMIHGGPGKRVGRGRSMDMAVVRGVGGFVAVLAAVVVILVIATGNV